MRNRRFRTGVRYLAGLLAGGLAFASLGASLGEELKIEPADARDAPPTPQLIADLPVGAPDPLWRG
jgi:hypothetical protein